MSDQNNIIIKVCSPAGQGKSTMAERITELLAADGFDVEHTPMEPLDRMMQYRRFLYRETRYDYMRFHGRISVVEEMVRRQGPES